MSITIQKAGILTTVQDLGRNGFRRFGINSNGVMDKTAVRLINILLGNNENEAVLEMHFPAPEILFAENAVCAIGGADFSPTFDGQKVENWKLFFVKKGTTLKFPKKVSGNRAYLAVKGGFEIEKWLGSASTNLTAKIGGFRGRNLQKGDCLMFAQDANFQNPRINIKISHSLIPEHSTSPVVRVLAGQEFKFLTAFSEQLFLKEDFMVGQNSDRMGFLLQGKPIYLLPRKEMISSAVCFGTIQLLSNGQMIILMADHQTTGGYPRIGQIIEPDLPLVAQLGANDKIAFRLISIEEAENISLHFEKNLNMLRTGCKFI